MRKITLLLVAFVFLMCSNSYFFTAAFEWIYVPDGTFDLKTDGDAITLSRSYGESGTDTYELKAEGEP